MTKSRLEAFSDGVLAIIITIMVLELKIPHEANLKVLYDLLPVFSCYLMSFIFIGIYWGNHHHLLHTVHKVSSKIIWSNMALLFFLSLIPFSTGWMGENNFDHLTVALYSVNLLLCAISFSILQTVIITNDKHSSKLIKALKKQEKKGMMSLLLYLLAIIFAFIEPWISGVFIIVTSIIWIIPDKHIQAALEDE